MRKAVGGCMMDASWDPLTQSAIRKRVERGTLRSDKGPDGRRYVYLDLAELGADDVADHVVDTSATHERDMLISQMQDEIEYLRDENRRKDEIIMQQAMTMRQLSAPREESPREPPPDAPGGPETATAPGTRETTPFTDEERPQEPSEPRSWWRRLWEG